MIGAKSFSEIGRREIKRMRARKTFPLRDIAFIIIVIETMSLCCYSYCFKIFGKGAKNPKKSQEVDFYSNTTLNISHKSSCQATLNKVQINVSKTRRCLVQF